MTTKFRAWDKHNQNMFANDELIIWNNNVYANDSKKLSWNYLKGWSIDEEYLMQSTGLFDENGVEIFEGDIVTDGDVISDIKYHQTLGFYMIGKYGFSVPFGQGVDVEYFEEFAVHVSKTFEVVGNIYENPELLEVNHDTIR